MHPIVLSTPALSAYITVLVAFVAGAFSLLNLTVSKENKVSEFRQAWIDALREDISCFLANSNWIRAEAREYLSSETADFATFLDKVRESLTVANQSMTRVKLRLHREEQNPKNLLLAMEEVERIIENARKEPDALGEKFNGALERVEMTASPVLKSEWEVVKRGERGYRFAKRIAYVLISASVVMLALLLLGVLQTGKSEKAEKTTRSFCLMDFQVYLCSHGMKCNAVVSAVVKSTHAATNAPTAFHRTR